MHIDLLNCFKNNEIYFYLAYPTLDSIDELIERCYKRGNNAIFTEKLRQNIVSWQDRKNNPKIVKILIIPKEKYLENILREEGILN